LTFFVFVYFSVFAGMTILCNFLLMVTWVPAWMVVHYKVMSMKEGLTKNQKLEPNQNTFLQK
jgi:hypothetical protein